MTKTKVLFGHYKIWRFILSLEWCIKDWWIGLYWEECWSLGIIDLYFNIVPCLPIHIRYCHPIKIYFNPKDDPNYDCSVSTKTKEEK